VGDKGNFAMQIKETMGDRKRDMRNKKRDNGRHWETEKETMGDNGRHWET
jgi:hypothetical protein